jgi:hypothetical protein
MFSGQVCPASKRSVHRILADGKLRGEVDTIVILSGYLCVVSWASRMVDIAEFGERQGSWSLFLESEIQPLERALLSISFYIAFHTSPV